MRGSSLIAGVGFVAGVAATVAYFGMPKPVVAATSDRYGDYILTTGNVSLKAGVLTDGVWMLDYKTGKLLGTVIDRNQGKIVGWAEVDLAAQFEVKPLQDVHFMMATGFVTQGQAALYVAETTTGKFGVYTMGPGPNGGGGIVIRQHDMTSFRQTQPVAAPAPAAAVPIANVPGPGPGVPVLAPVPVPVAGPDGK